MRRQLGSSSARAVPADIRMKSLRVNPCLLGSLQWAVVDMQLASLVVSRFAIMLRTLGVVNRSGPGVYRMLRQ